jgi:hypothetical protein
MPGILSADHIADQKPFISGALSWNAWPSDGKNRAGTLLQPKVTDGKYMAALGDMAYIARKLSLKKEALLF